MQAEALPSNDSAARDMNIVITAYTIAQVSLGTLSGHTLANDAAIRPHVGHGFSDKCIERTWVASVPAYTHHHHHHHHRHHHLPSYLEVYDSLIVSTHRLSRHSAAGSSSVRSSTTSPTATPLAVAVGASLDLGRGTGKRGPVRRTEPSGLGARWCKWPRCRCCGW